MKKIQVLSLFLALAGSLFAQRKEFAEPVTFDLTKSIPLFSETTGFGIDLADNAPIASWRGDGGEPFYFSVNVPDGNYRVTLTLGSKKRAGVTTVRGESRRTFVHRCETAKGKTTSVSFVVNKHTPDFVNEKGKADRINLKPREVEKLNWDNKLTLEFNGEAPCVQKIAVERVEVPTLYLCGNSTVTDQEFEPYASWGQLFTEFFDAEVAVSNYAESGETAEGFIARKRLAHVASGLKAGDYVFVEFGHNDQKNDGKPGYGAFYNFMQNLKMFADVCKKADAQLVLCTPIRRLMFDANGKIKDTHADYPEAIRFFAQKNNIPVIDLQAQTGVMFETWGEETSKHALTFYPAGTYPGQDKELADRTHTNAFGAYEVAKLVAQGIVDNNLPLKSHLANWTDFNPAQADNWETFYYPMAAKVDATRPEEKGVNDQVQYWPDGTAMDAWFQDLKPVDISALGKQYKLTDYGIFADGQIHTAQIQALIDRIAAEGGGVLVVPAGLYITGGLYFKQGTHLHLEEGAILQGSDFIGDYNIAETRIEGETCKYFEALINVKNVDGFTLTGKGIIDGNGLRYHRAFWMRRSWNPKCTNKDEQRPRLIYVADSKNVRLEGVRLQNSPFWTTHIYRSERVRLLNLSIYSLAQPNTHKGPSTDAVDLDVVKDVLVHGCYMEVNDDAIALKGGKGPWADDPAKAPGNGENRNILIEDCHYGYCHGCLTCGSESVFDHNVVLRRIQIDHAVRLLWLKMRPDTPQRYEYISVEDCHGTVNRVLYVHPWTQFYDLKDRKDMPRSTSAHVTMRNCTLHCDTYKDIEEAPDQYDLTDFKFENMKVTEKTKTVELNNQEYQNTDMLKK